MVSGKIFRGNSNNIGQSHWFETESYSLDYSLVTPEHPDGKEVPLPVPIGDKVSLKNM